MKYIRLYLIFLFFMPCLHAHEEPAKTMHDVRDKQQERQRILRLQIRSSTAWHYEILDGEATGHKHEVLLSQYNKAGLLQSSSLFDESGILDSRVVYDYDGHGNMIRDSDYNGDGELLEYIEYSYDEAGRVTGSVNYAGDVVDSKFEYRRNTVRNSVEFRKYDANGALEYRIDYLYDGNLDDGRPTKIRKYERDGRTLMSVTYSYFPSGKVKEKSVFDRDGSLMHRFLYQWDERGFRKEIAKILPGDVTDSIQRFTCDRDGNVGTVEAFDRENVLIAKTVYEYLCGPSDSCGVGDRSRWHDKFCFIRDIPAITFHYDHGLLAGSYPAGRETVDVGMEDVSVFLGHVCLCGAGGYRIAGLALESLKAGDSAPERGDFVLISGRDHTVSDVIAYVLGCSRRNDSGTNRYFIDASVEAPKRVYHYFIGYPPLEKAVHVVYRKHLLIGNEMMDRLWKVETGYEEDPASVSREEIDLYQETMERMVRDVLMDRRAGLIEAQPIDYRDFSARLNRLKKDAQQNR